MLVNRDRSKQARAICLLQGSVFTWKWSEGRRDAVEEKPGPSRAKKLRIKSVWRHGGAWKEEQARLYWELPRESLWYQINHCNEQQLSERWWKGNMNPEFSVLLPPLFFKTTTVVVISVIFSGYYVPTYISFILLMCYSHRHNGRKDQVQLQHSDLLHSPAMTVVSPLTALLLIIRQCFKSPHCFGSKSQWLWRGDWI